MRRTIKAAGAAGAAAALLLGGAGSLAYWQAADDSSPGIMTSGHLSLTPAGQSGWTLNGNAVTDQTTVRVVPGDTLVFTGSYQINASGDALAAEVTVTGAETSGTLSDYLTASDVEYTVDGQAGVDTVTAANDGDTLRATVGVDFPFGATADNASQAQVVNLSDISVSLRQTDLSS
jgi:alternate signal-mediated exported protein